VARTTISSPRAAFAADLESISSGAATAARHSVLTFKVARVTAPRNH